MPAAPVIVGAAGVVLCGCVGGVCFDTGTVPRAVLRPVFYAVLWAVFLAWCLCCCDVVETSYEGHMVDALASRADEGRWSLR